MGLTHMDEIRGVWKVARKAYSYTVTETRGPHNEEVRRLRKFHMKGDVRVLLHNIRSAHNVGAIFRTADALGVNKIYLSGYTPAPVDRFGRPVKEIAKTALGAERTISWEYAKRPERFLRTLRKEGFVIVGIEQDKRAIDYKKFTPRDKTVFLVGNEVRGLSAGLCGQCDTLLEIPVRGKKESLNVSVAFGVALFRIFDE